MSLLYPIGESHLPKFRLGSEACRKGAYAMLLEMVQLMMVEKAYLALRQFLPSPSTYYFCLL